MENTLCIYLQATLCWIYTAIPNAVWNTFKQTIFMLQVLVHTPNYRQMKTATTKTNTAFKIKSNQKLKPQIFLSDNYKTHSC